MVAHGAWLTPAAQARVPVLLAAAKWRCVPVLPRTCGTGFTGGLRRRLIRAKVRSGCEVGGSPVLPGLAAKNAADGPPFWREFLKPENQGENSRWREVSQALLLAIG